jgi:hypothetical protein
MITIDNSVKDLGNISHGVLTSCTFKVTNHSETSVLAVDLKSGCGCTVPIFSENPIPALSTIDLRLDYTPNGGLGDNMKSAYFTVDGTEHTVYIKANVI